MNEDHSFIVHLKEEARLRGEEEEEFRRTMNARVAALAEARAFAYRRMNIMSSLLRIVGDAEDEGQAVAAAIAGLRDRLGWLDESPARDEVLAEYARLAAIAFSTLSRTGDSAEPPPLPMKGKQQPDLITALADFETWYQQARGKPFWVLFEHYMPETQLVDF